MPPLECGQAFSERVLLSRLDHSATYIHPHTLFLRSSKDLSLVSLYPRHMPRSRIRSLLTSTERPESRLRKQLSIPAADHILHLQRR